MSFYIGDKVEYLHGWPSFDFITDKKQHYVVFPKTGVFKDWNDQDRAIHLFHSKMHGPAKAKNLGDPFSTALWHNSKNHFDAVPSYKLQQYLKNKGESEKGKDEEGKQYSLPLAVKMASEKLEQIKMIRRVMNLRRQKTMPKPHKIIIPKKGPGSFKRIKRVELEP